MAEMNEQMPPVSDSLELVHRMELFIAKDEIRNLEKCLERLVIEREEVEHERRQLQLRLYDAMRYQIQLELGLEQKAATLSEREEELTRLAKNNSYLRRIKTCLRDSKNELAEESKKLEEENAKLGQENAALREELAQLHSQLQVL
uniref:Uncharacterized protein n=1 Tax=Mycena chlorophos TaxID=658473 RepID=A0ABQ0L7W9_MYCCL|nr:predicted protein [Mycena chlorophos]